MAAAVFVALARLGRSKLGLELRALGSDAFCCTNAQGVHGATTVCFLLVKVLAVVFPGRD